MRPPDRANLSKAFQSLRYWRGALSFDDPATGKHYALGPKPAVLMVRPRGWHLDERHLGVAASLFDFGLYLWHNAHEAIEAGSGPYFYLPKLESHHEAALWSDVFAFYEERSALHAADQCDGADRDDPAAFE